MVPISFLSRWGFWTKRGNHWGLQLWGFIPFHGASLFRKCFVSKLWWFLLHCFWHPSTCLMHGSPWMLSDFLIFWACSLNPQTHFLSASLFEDKHFCKIVPRVSWYLQTCCPLVAEDFVTQGYGRSGGVPVFCGGSISEYNWPRIGGCIPIFWKCSRCQGKD
jgi:hypothetical protein